MNDQRSLIEQQHVPADDGWDDAAGEASERMIRGHLLKFADWRWTLGKEATPIDNRRKDVALPLDRERSHLHNQPAVESAGAARNHRHLSNQAPAWLLLDSDW